MINMFQFVAGYLESVTTAAKNQKSSKHHSARLTNSSSSSEKNTVSNSEMKVNRKVTSNTHSYSASNPSGNYSTHIDVPKPIAVEDVSDVGLFITAKSRSGNFVDFYGICDMNCTRVSIPKYRINTNGIKSCAIKMFRHKSRIYICYSTRSQQLQIKYWCFKSKTVSDTHLPLKMRFLKPRLINVVADEILVSEEKYVKLPLEGFKITASKFGLESESYKTIDFTYYSLKEIICFKDEVNAFSSQKSEVLSFNLNTSKRTPRGKLNYNGVVEAVIFHSNLYVGCYNRTKCCLFVEQFDSDSNQWNVVSRSTVFS